MKDREVIQKINFSEIKEKFAYLNMKPVLAKESDSKKNDMKIGDVETNKSLQQDTSVQQQKTVKKVQDLIDKIKDTAITVRFFKDNGLMRAHVINRINETLLATIPGYLNGQDSEKEVFSKMNEQVLSNLLVGNTGSNVDKQA